MADNAVKYGFRWSKAYNGGKSCPAPTWHKVATGYQASPGSSVDLNIGDCVKLASGGNVQLAVGTEGTPGAVWGVIVAVGPSWDGEKMIPRTFIPGGTAWGTVLERRSMAGVVPINAGAWSIDVTGNTTSFDTETEYLNAVGKNADITNLPTTTAPLRATQRLDISTAATTNTLVFRILTVDTTVENQDFSGNFVKMVVTGNVVQNAPDNTTGV